MPQISKAIRSAILIQLQGTTGNANGVNDRIAALATAYGIPPYPNPLFDWTDNSVSFFFGQIDPAALEESSPFTYPLLTIDCPRSQNTNRVKFATFAGPVVAVIDVHHSWEEDSAIHDFASFVDATEDAVIGCLNNQSVQTWPGNLLWNGQVMASRGPIRAGGQGWLQSLRFTCNFELVV